MAMWLVFGTALSPLRAAPSQAVSMLRSSPSAIGEVTTQVSIFGQQAWQATGVKGLDSFAALKTDLTARYDRTRPVTRNLLDQTGNTLMGVGADAHALWTSFVSDPEEQNEKTESRQD